MSNQRTLTPALHIRHTGQVFPLTQAPVTMGRQGDNTIVLADPQSSRHHASIVWEAGAFVVQDLGSANGTYVNERRIAHPQPLRDGDVLRLGNTVFDVRLPPTAADQDRTMAEVGVLTGEAAGPPKRSALPIVVGLLIAGIVIVGLAILALVLFTGGREGGLAVSILSPSQGAEIAIGQETVLQATATGAKDITRLELKVDGATVGVSSSPDPAGTESLTVSQPWTFSQAGLHTVSAVAYTASDKASEPASVEVVASEAIAQETPGATPSVAPATASPSATPGPTSETPSPTTPTDTSTPTNTPTSTSTNTPTATPTPTQYPAPQIAFFQANPTTIFSGECTALEWGAVTNASAATIDHGIGGVATPGNQTVCPTETTTYVMTATGPGGTATASATVTVQPGQPDLTVASIVFVPTPPVQNQDNEVQITIQNIGTSAAGPFQWEWQPGSAAPLGGSVPGGLNAGQSLVVTAIWNPASWYSNLPTVARVDVGNAVAESNEDNNELQVNVAVAAAPSPTTVSLTSQAALDGFLTNSGGGNRSIEIRVGNGPMVGSPPYEYVVRGFMSFDLSGIPAGATIQSIELRFYQVQVNGNPYGKLGNLRLKHVDYGSSLDASDFDTPELNSANLTPHTSAGEWYVITASTIADWIAQDLAAGRSRLQMRLQFTTETDGDGAEDTVSFESGDNFFGTGNVPQLNITYTP